MFLPESQRLALIVLSAWALFAPAARATDLDLADLSLEQLLEVNVVSASKFEQRGRDAPSAVQVISREEIRRHGWRTLTEALNTLPGLYASNDKVYDFLGARGFQIPGDYNTRFLLLVDGQRNNDNVYQSALTGTEAWLDMSAIERIEYIPGPGSALYGANAMFGVINVLTRQGEATGLREAGLRLSDQGGQGVNLISSQTLKGEAQDTRVFLQYSADQQAGRDLGYSDPLGQLLRADGSVSPDGVAHGLDSGRNQHLMARVDRGELSVRLIHHERTVHPSAANYATLFDDPAMRVVDGGTQINVALDHALGEQQALYARLGYTDFYYRASYPYLDSGIGYYHNFDDVRGQVLEGELHYRWRSGAHQLITGVEFSHDLQARQQNFNSVPAATLGTADVDLNTSTTRTALFIQDAWQLNKAWLLSLGLRLDRASTQDTTSSPRLGVIWQAAPDWTVKFLAGRAYRSPNAYESQFSNGAAYLSNPSLQAETIRTTEGVLEWRRDERSRWQLSLYENQLDKLIQQIDTNASGVLQFQNRGSTRIQGLELGLEQKHASGLQWRASLALNQASSSVSSTQDNSPTWIAKASASAPVFHAAMFLAGELQLIGPRTYAWNATPYAVPTEVLANVTATLPSLYSKGWQAQLRISNLFNRRLEHPGSAETPSPTVPQPGRGLSATISYAF
jgi:outer membrane receptor protein involved in Fe transport